MSKFYEELDLVRKHVEGNQKVERERNESLHFIDEVVLGGIGRFFTAIFVGIWNAICFVAKAVFGLLFLLIVVAIFLAIIKVFFKIVGFGLGI